MPRLIDADALASDLTRFYENEVTARKLIAEQPTIDAVPVVRCRECKHAVMTYGGECKYCDFWQEDGGEALYLDGDFYCAAGERKEDKA